MGPIGERYLLLHERFVALAQAWDEEDVGRPVPACPGWTVHDVVSHVTGIVEDALAGRSEGAATDPWTAAQVARGRDRSADAMIASWQEHAGSFASVLDAMGERRPPFDLLTHELDVRSALGLPIDRGDPLLAEVAAEIAGSIELRVPIEIRADGVVVRPAFDPAVRGESTGGQVPPLAVTTSSFELFRSLFGRRTVAQVRAYAWSDDPGPALDDWFIFGPAQQEIVE